MATKRLARRLGVVRSSSGMSAGGLRPRPRQLFSYLIVIDFESTCWSDGQKRGQEIIEFPAVLLNASDGEIESEFHMYVQPQEHPILSEFCTELTGIKQNQVDEGAPLHTCLSQFSKWIQKIQKEKKIDFHSTPASCTAAEGKLCTFVTWSDWDLGVCLHYECKRKQLRKPDMLNSWIDLRATYKLFYSRKPQGLTGALQDVGISFAGREHCGLDDSRNTARLAWRMICDGCVMKITKSLDKAPPAPNSIARFLSVKPSDCSPLGSNYGTKASCLDEGMHSEAARTKNVSGEQTQELISVHLCGNIHVTQRNRKKAGARVAQSCWIPCTGSLNFPLGCLPPSYSNSLVGIQSRLNNEHLPSNSSVCNTALVLVSTTLSSVSVSDTEISTTSDCLSMLADWEDVALIPDSQHNQSSEFLMLNKDPENTSALTFGDTEDGNGSNVNLGSEKVGKTSLNIELSNKTVLVKNPTITVYNNATVPNKFTNPFAFRLSATKAVAPSEGALKENFVTLSSGTHKKKSSSPKSLPPAKKPPLIVYEDKEVASKSSRSFRSLGSHLVPSGALKSSVNVGWSAENQRVTPPLCLCGRRARKLNVSNGGPNHGRAFYSCPVGKWEGQRKGCGYFKWEHALLKEKRAVPSLPSAVGLQLQRTSVSSSGHPQHKFLHLRPSMRT